MNKKQFTQTRFHQWLKSKGFLEVGDVNSSHLNPLAFFVMDNVQGSFAFSIGDEVFFRTIDKGEHRFLAPNWALYFLSLSKRRYTGKVRAAHLRSIMEKMPANIEKYQRDQVRALHVL